MNKKKIIDIAVLEGMKHQLKTVPFGDVVDNVQNFIQHLRTTKLESQMAKDAYNIMRSIEIGAEKALELTQK